MYVNSPCNGCTRRFPACQMPEKCDDWREYQELKEREDRARREALKTENILNGYRHDLITAAYRRRHKNGNKKV